MLSWRITGQALEVLDQSTGSWARLCDAFGISRVDVDLLTGIHEVELYVDSARGGLNSMMVKRDALCKNSIMSKLYSLGLSLLDTDDDIPIIQQILFECEQSAPLVYHHDRLGFVPGSDNELFLLDTPIGTVDPVKAASRYSMPNLMTPRGSLEEWKALVRNEVLGHSPMELALAIGAVAPVAHLLRAAGVITDLPILAYIGPTSTGKSSALKVGASIWGFPMESVGIIDDLNSTENAFFETLARNAGVPAFIDETSAQPDWDFDRVIYFLPKGRSKRRCDASGSLRKTAVLSGAVIFTGEHSLLKRAAKDSGLQARIAELTLDRWTKDGAHAERISEGFCQHYGTAAPKLVQWLMDHQGELPDLFRIERGKLFQRLSQQSAVEGRVQKIHAMILVAAHAACEALGLEMDLEKLRALLLDQLVNSRPEQDRMTSTYNALLEIVAENGSKFTWPSKRTADHPSGKDVWGTFEYQKSTPCIWIGLNRFTTMLRSTGIREFKEITRPFSERGWLVDFGSRHYYRNHKINGVLTSAVCLLLPASPSLLERLEALPSNASSHELVKALRGDSFEANVCSGQPETDCAIQNAVETPSQTLMCGFSKPCAQGEVFLINKPLSVALGIKDEVFATVIADEKLLMLSVEPLTRASVKFKLKAWQEQKVSTNATLTRALMCALRLNLPAGKAVALTSIEVQTHKGASTAVVGADFDDTIGIICGDISGWEFPDPDVQSAPCSTDDLSICGCNGTSNDEVLKRRAALLCEEPDE